MTIICEGCNKEFDCSTKKYNYNRKAGFRIFCSRECSNNYRKILAGTLKICAHCGKQIFKYNKEISKSKTGNVYCSRSCSAANNNKLFKKWKNHPSYRNGASRYRQLKLDSVESPKCERCGFDNIIALEVHHKDRNRENNDLSNLEVLCCNCHTLEHRKIENVV